MLTRCGTALTSDGVRAGSSMSLHKFLQRAQFRLEHEIPVRPVAQVLQQWAVFQASKSFLFRLAAHNPDFSLLHGWNSEKMKPLLTLVCATEKTTTQKNIAIFQAPNRGPGFGTNSCFVDDVAVSCAAAGLLAGSLQQRLNGSMTQTLYLRHFVVRTKSCFQFRSLL